jgi:putative drug exporter of the RND superfamily
MVWDTRDRSTLAMSRELPGGRWNRWGLLMHRRRWTVVFAWLLVALASAPFLGTLTDNLTSGGFEVPASQSLQVAELKKAELPGEHVRTSVLVLHSDSLTVDDPAYAEALTAARDALTKAPGVSEVTDPLATRGAVSPDRRTVIVTVGIDEPQDAAFKHAAKLETDVDNVLAGTEVAGNLAGDAPFYAAFQHTASEDLKGAETFIAPLSALILVVALGAVLLGFVPLLVAGLALVVSLAMISLLAEHTVVNILTQNIATMIGLGVGIDYTLFVLRPYRRALVRTGHPAAAVAEAMADCGRGISVSALTVMLSMSGTLIVDVPAYRSMGLGAMVAVGVAAASALTLLPAVVCILGRRVELGRLRTPRAHVLRRWPRMATWPVRRPWAAGSVSVLVLLILAAPALSMKLGTSGPAILPEDAPPRVAAERLAASFGGGSASPVEVVLQLPAAADSPAARVDVATVQAALDGQPEVLRVLPAQIREASPGSAMALLTVITRHGPQSDQVIALVKDLRADLPGLVGDGSRILVGGEPAQNVDLNDQVGGSVPLVIAWVLALSFALLLFAFRSLLIAAKAVVTNLLSVLATYGVLVLVFQEGHGAGLVSVAAPGFIEVFLPLFLFCILFGLSMDYEVFLLSEVRAERLRDASCLEATTRAVTSTAGIITTAAAIMVVVFTGFALTSLIPIQAIGFGLAVAILLDATVVRLMLVPAVLVLLGERNWWLPRWLDALLPGSGRVRARRRLPLPVQKDLAPVRRG